MHRRRPLTGTGDGVAIFLSVATAEMKRVAGCDEVKLLAVLVLALLGLASDELPVPKSNEEDDAESP